MSVRGEREQVALRVVTDGASDEQSGGFDAKKVTFYTHPRSQCLQ